MKPNKNVKAKCAANTLRNRNKKQTRNTSRRAMLGCMIAGSEAVPVTDLLGLGGAESVQLKRMAKANRESRFHNAMAHAFAACNL
tara:strand:- start:325 stop:579 length:255 start_codon:yes stop_codon:yes gene_type:complete